MEDLFKSCAEEAAANSYYYDNFQNYTVKYKHYNVCRHPRDSGFLCKTCARSKKLIEQNFVKDLEKYNFDKIYEDLGKRKYFFYEKDNLIGHLQFGDFEDPFISTVSGSEVYINEFLVPRNSDEIIKEYMKLDHEKEERPTHNNWLDELCWKINKGEVAVGKEIEEDPEIAWNKYSHSIAALS